jgi:hypothetical protein
MVQLQLVESQSTHFHCFGEAPRERYVMCAYGLYLLQLPVVRSKRVGGRDWNEDASVYRVYIRVALALSRHCVLFD